jgi:hypothetical protein
MVVFVFDPLRDRDLLTYMFTLNFLLIISYPLGQQLSFALVVSTSIAPSTGAAGAKCRLNFANYGFIF